MLIAIYHNYDIKKTGIDKHNIILIYMQQIIKNLRETAPF